MNAAAILVRKLLLPHRENDPAPIPSEFIVHQVQGCVHCEGYKVKPCTTATPTPLNLQPSYFASPAPKMSVHAHKGVKVYKTRTTKYVSKQQ